MSDERPTEQSSNPGEPRAYEVLEFVKAAPGEDLVLTRQDRTIFHPDGRISQETQLLENLFEKLVPAFNGYVYKASGQLTGHFDGPERARDCARELAFHYNKAVEISGSRIRIVM